MQTEVQRLESAIEAIRVRFGDQALLRASRLPSAEPWSTGIGELDRLTGIRGLPAGRLSVLQGPAGSGKLSIALALLGRATRELAQAVVLDHGFGFDPWALEPMRPDLARLTLVRPPNAGSAGEAAVALARAGASFLLLLGELPEPALGPLESSAARSGCLVLSVASDRDAALAHASSLTLGVERSAWLRERGEVIGLQASVTCVKNRLAAPGAATELEVRYPVGARHFPERPIALVQHEGDPRWVVRTAVG